MELNVLINNNSTIKMNRQYFNHLDTPANIFSLAKVPSADNKRDDFLVVTSRDIYLLTQKKTPTKKSMLSPLSFNRYSSLSMHPGKSSKEEDLFVTFA